MGWLRLDGWQNVFTALGVQGKDKRLGAKFEAPVLVHEQLVDLYRANDVAARIVEQLPENGLREGWGLSIGKEQDKELADKMLAKIDEMEWNETIKQAVCWQRAYGGAITLLGVRDGASLSSPLEIERAGTFEWLTNFHAGEVKVETWYEDPREPSFGRPKLYKILDKTHAGGPQRTRPDVLIHESRCLVWDGVRVDRQGRQSLSTNNGWGDSVLVRCHEVLRDFGLAWGGVAVLLQDFAQAVYKIEGLSEMLAAGQEEQIKKRMSIMDYARSVLRAILLDSNEEFERKTTNLTGIPEMLDRFQTRLAAAAQMPVTILMGISPAGLNATGESDTRHWYDSVRAWQEKALRPKLNRLLEVAFAAQNWPAKGKEPEAWTVKFNSLWQMTEMEKAELRSKMAAADKAYVDATILLPEEVAMSRFGGDEYSLETVLDDELREAFKEEEEAQLEAQNEIALAQAENPPPPPTNGAKNVSPNNVAAQQANGPRPETRRNVADGGTA